MRIEKDSLGDVEIPEKVLWGAQTQRSLNNFRISGIKFPKIFLESLLILKKCCALANNKLDEINCEIASVIVQSVDEIIKEEKWDQFPLDIYQTGSGTQTNMNANEVLANMANLNLGFEIGQKHPVHPNDHVNKSQSSNDIIPSAMYVSTLRIIVNNLMPALEQLISALNKKKTEFQDISKVARTHLQDAVPITLGQEFSSYESQLISIKQQIENSQILLTKLPVGGTAVGTGINSHPKFGQQVCELLNEEFNGLNFETATNKFAKIAAHDDIVLISGLLKTLAVALIKISNDIRLYASGPRCGFGEIKLPINEPGSSIMPGKVNPTQIEALIQVCFSVIGNDSAITAAGFFGGQMDLNTAKPLMIHLIIQSITLLSNAMNSFREKCVKDIIVNKKQIDLFREKNIMIGTSLVPILGYDKVTEIINRAYKEDKVIKEIILKDKEIEEETKKELLKILNLK